MTNLTKDDTDVESQIERSANCQHDDMGDRHLGSVDGVAKGVKDVLFPSRKGLLSSSQVDSHRGYLTHGRGQAVEDLEHVDNDVKLNHALGLDVVVNPAKRRGCNRGGRQ